MGIMAQFLLLWSSILIFFTIPAQSVNSCKPDSCDRNSGPTVRFPFWLKNRQQIHCGYRGFNLYCNSKKQTIIKLPQSGEFIVNHINYSAQAISINDPDLCLPNRIMNFSLSGSPFRGFYARNYTFLNCSSSWMAIMVYTSSSRYQPLRCLSGRNYTVLATDLDSYGAQVPPTCRGIANVSVPIKWTVSPFYWASMDFGEDLELHWSEPECFNCERQGRVCGFKDSSSLEISCHKPPNTGLPRSAKYGIIIGVGIPGIVCIVGLACYTCGKIREFRHRHELPITTFSDQQSSITTAGGLDEPTIESYPKTVLGVSRRLPNPSDGTCPICLCEYQPKETLRSIPECNHYFHADCIDEWLKLNGTCPLCRNSPDSSVATPCFSMSLSSPSLSTASD